VIRASTPTGSTARSSTTALLALALLLPALSGCGARVLRETIRETPRTRIVLRSVARGGEPQDRGFDHPAIISPVRLTHILARVDVIPGDGAGAERRPALEVEQLFEVAEGLSEALARATPAQEVVVLTTHRERTLGVFTHDYLTSFVAFVKDDLLHLHFGHVGFELPRDTGVRVTRWPEPEPGVVQMKFRVVPSEAMDAIGPQSLAIAWRDPIFRRASAVRVTPTGRVLRRTILMEEPLPAAPEPAEPEPPDPGSLAPETLRELADLEEARRAGRISEAAYQTRRREILARDPGAD